VNKLYQTLLDMKVGICLAYFKHKMKIVGRALFEAAEVKLCNRSKMLNHVRHSFVI
jgi:hypothetical protein